MPGIPARGAAPVSVAGPARNRVARVMARDLAVPRDSARVRNLAAVVRVKAVVADRVMGRVPVRAAASEADPDQAEVDRVTVMVPVSLVAALVSAAGPAQVVAARVPWAQVTVRVGLDTVATSAPAVARAPVRVPWAQVMVRVGLDTVATSAPVVVRVPVRAPWAQVTDRVIPALASRGGSGRAGVIVPNSKSLH